MGSHMKRSIFDEQTSKALKKWHQAVKKKNPKGSGNSPSRSPNTSPKGSPKATTVHPIPHFKATGISPSPSRRRHLSDQGLQYATPEVLSAPAVPATPNPAFAAPADLLTGSAEQKKPQAVGDSKEDEEYSFINLSEEPYQSDHGYEGTRRPEEERESEKARERERVGDLFEERGEKLEQLGLPYPTFSPGKREEGQTRCCHEWDPAVVTRSPSARTPRCESRPYDGPDEKSRPFPGTEHPSSAPISMSTKSCEKLYRSGGRIRIRLGLAVGSISSRTAVRVSWRSIVHRFCSIPWGNSAPPVGF
ncbi:hypothetical protein BHE74_00011541 [Ensete ventricosum]|nr:hypothetical protein BHE74_00011541 [Ensete ventricosum]